MKAVILEKNENKYKYLICLKDLAEKHEDFKSSRRLSALILNMDKKSAPEIAQMLGVSRSQVSEWLRKFLNHGPSSLIEGRRSGRPPKIAAIELKKIADILKKKPSYYGFFEPRWTCLMIREIIWTKYKIRYHPAHLSKLKRLINYSFLYSRGNRINKY